MKVARIKVSFSELILGSGLLLRFTSATTSGTEASDTRTDAEDGKGGGFGNGGDRSVDRKG